MATKHLACDNCGSSDAVYPYDNGNYCFSCGQKTKIKKQKTMMKPKELKLPDDLTLPFDTTNQIEEFPDHAKLWLYKYHLTDTQIKFYNIGYSASYDRIILPVYGYDDQLMYYQARALVKSKFKYLNPSVKKVEFWSGTIRPTTRNGSHTKTVVLVEDIISAIRVGEHTQAVALLGKQPTLELVGRLDGKNLIIWLDNDAWVDAINLVRELSAWGNKVNMIQTIKDPKEYSPEQMKTILLEHANDF